MITNQMSHRKISFCERIHIYFSKLFLSQSDASVKKISETIQMFERWMRNLKYLGKVCFLLLEIVARRCFGTKSFLKNWYRKLLDCCVCVVLSLWEFALLLVNLPIWYLLKIPENFWFSGVFGDYKLRIFAGNE